MESIDRFAHLRNAAPKRHAALADVGVAEIFVFGAEEPGSDSDHAEEGHRDQELALHGRASRLENDTKGDKAFMV